MGSVDWTQVLVALVAGLAAGLPAIVTSVLAFKLRRDVRIPSGGTIGEAVERTHDLSAADVAMTTNVHKIVSGRNALTWPHDKD